MQTHQLEMLSEPIGVVIKSFNHYISYAVVQMFLSFTQLVVCAIGVYYGMENGVECDISIPTAFKVSMATTTLATVLSSYLVINLLCTYYCTTKETIFSQVTHVVFKHNLYAGLPMAIVSLAATLYIICVTLQTDSVKCDPKLWGYSLAFSVYQLGIVGESFIALLYHIVLFCVERQRPCKAITYDLDIEKFPKKSESHV